MSQTGPGEPQRNLPQPPPSGWSREQPRTGTHAATGATGAMPFGSDGSTATEGDAGARRRKLLLIGIGAAVALVVVVVVVLMLTRGDGGGSPAPAAETVTLASPVPTTEPVARTATTAFSAALPTSVLQYALATSVNDDTWIAAGALEAYSETFTDGGTGQVVVQAGQWETPAEAAAQVQAMSAALPSAAIPTSPSPTASAGATTAPAVLPAAGDVLVDGSPVGTFSIVDAGDGTGIAIWSNGTTVFRVTAPVVDVRDVYAAFPL